MPDCGPKPLGVSPTLGWSERDVKPSRMGHGTYYITYKMSVFEVSRGKKNLQDVSERKYIFLN
jgi:hypothetical protein